jgi:hypothetical protein
MELALQNYIEALEVTSGISDLSDEIPQIVRRTNPSVGKTSTFVCSVLEPHNMILPLNVIWIDFNPNSSTYRNALMRVSKDPKGLYENSWEVQYYYDNIWNNQYYDEEDSALINSGNSIDSATTSSMGIVLISTAPEMGQIPVAITEGDPRLTDPRTALPHSHQEKPTTQLQHSEGVITIEGGPAPEGSVLRFNGNGSASWSKLTESDLDPIIQSQ